MDILLEVHLGTSTSGKQSKVETILAVVKGLYDEARGLAVQGRISRMVEQRQPTLLDRRCSGGEAPL